jgi:hypothetical protein
VTGGAASVVRAYSGTACTGPLTYINCAGTTVNAAAPNLDLTALTPSTTYYVRVNEYSTSGTLGNFTICATPVPNCPVPTGATVGTITNTTAVLSWTATPATGSTFTVIYGPTGFTPPSGTGSTTVTGITGLTTTITGLQPSTGYQFYVQQVCGGFNGSSTLTPVVAFTTPLTPPTNDDICGAVAFGTTAVTGSNVGATTTAGPSNPVCSGASQPKDVWFSFVPNGTTTALTLTGAPAGTVRVYSGSSCSATLTLMTCASSGAANTALTAPVNVTGLTAGQRYYVAVSGYGSNDTAGSFTIVGTGLAVPTATRAQFDTNALVVYPNPSNTGQLTLKLSNLSGAGHATLLNALGQVVLTKSLTGTAEQTLSTRGLATGVYTLRIEAGSDVLTRKVVLE